MPDPVEYNFDFSSPYGYFASEKIDEMAASYARAVLWRPFLLGVDRLDQVEKRLPDGGF